MNKTTVNLVPNNINPTPDYYCTWQTQLYASSDGKPNGQRRVLTESALFDTQPSHGWASFYEQARQDLLLVLDDGWDLPLSNDPAYYGCLHLSEEKFPHFTETDTNALRPLAAKIREQGWKGLGVWVCAGEAPLYAAECSAEDYWIRRLRAAHEAGIAYWKVDWGTHAAEVPFRRRLTELARQYAPHLTVEHACVTEVIPHSDVFRTYDVPAIMSVPITMAKLAAFGAPPAPVGANRGLINCEDEAYLAAAGGYAMGIMRHPLAGNLPNGCADMSFPAVHRNLKTKLFEVVRAARWHRLAPAFGGGTLAVSATNPSDMWEFHHREEELESWWFENATIVSHICGEHWTESAPACLARNTALPHLSPNEGGEQPFCMASRHPNGTYTVATLGRTHGRKYTIPACDVTVHADNAHTFGVFGCYRTLILETTAPCRRVLMQDLADNCAYDITSEVTRQSGRLILGGDLIHRLGTGVQPPTDTSEPGVVVQLVP